MKLVKAYKEIQKINNNLEPYPYEVWSKLIGRTFTPRIMDNQFCLSPDGDYCSIDEARTAVEYLVNQFGGTVKWEKQ